MGNLLVRAGRQKFLLIVSWPSLHAPAPEEALPNTKGGGKITHVAARLRGDILMGFLDKHCGGRIAV